jgi:hypothetical protein
MTGVIAALSVPLCTAIVATTAAAAAPTVKYGVIEIGAKGVKGYTFDLDRAAKDPSCSGEGEAYLKCIDPTSTDQVNVNPISDPDFKATLAGIEQLWNDFKPKYDIPPDHVYLVTSSSLAAEEAKRDLLIAQILKDKNLKLSHGVDTVSVDQEATYALYGVLGMLPDNVRKMRTGQAAIIDIGSGNVKGAYQNTEAANKSVVVFGVPFGTKVATDAINKERGSEEFRKAADTWRAKTFVPKLRTELENKQGVTNRNRVYLTGGIVWSLATLTNPDDTVRKFPPIDPKSIDAMIDRAAAPDAAATLCSDAQKTKYKEVRKVCDTFSPAQMVAGFEILKGLSEELQFVAAKKHVFFFRDALYAWPLGYLRDKLYGDNASKHTGDQTQSSASR